jgi:hypothetical protein
MIVVPRFLLHIGRHKTGTSSLQRFLYRNREQLEKYGFYYPMSGLTGLAHHDIARHFYGRALERFPAEERHTHAQCVHALFEEIEGRHETVLLSSEGFQNCNPNSIEQFFPTGQTKIIVYIREQSEYLVSAYQQKVQATNYFASLEEFSQEFKVNYDVFLQKWERSFGLGNVTARLYGRSHLKGGDIVEDFCDAAGIPNSLELHRPSADQNPSIGGALLEFKRFLNTLDAPKNTDTALYKAFSILASRSAEWRQRPFLSPETLQSLRQVSRASNARVFERYPEMSEGFGHPEAGGQSDTAHVVSAEAIFEVAEQLTELLSAESDRNMDAAVFRKKITWSDLRRIYMEGRMAPNYYAQQF